MKSIVSELIAVFQQRDVRKNLRSLMKVLLLLVGVVAVYSVGFHMLMLHEGQNHSWMTGLYWTLTVMSTLGFGDITFHTDLGRGFSILVLVSGVVLLLIVLPFAFIRNFYAPWLEAQIRIRAPRSVPPTKRDHVILCRQDSLGDALVPRLKAQGVGYVIIEPEPAQAVAMLSEGVDVLVGEPDNEETWKAARVQSARLVVANLGDAENTNATLTVREVAPKVPIAAIVENEDAVDILELSGADHVIALKQRLGAHLAAHVGAGGVTAFPVGHFMGLIIAEFLVRRTELVGRTIRETDLREETGLHVIACRDRGMLTAAGPHSVLTEDSVIVVVGTDAQIQMLNETYASQHPSDEPVLVIGGGNVGRAAAKALRERGVKTTIIDSDESLAPAIKKVSERLILGDAANIDVMLEAGIERTPSVMLTTHDDATNIYLAIYARRLNPSCHIVSRVTRERNLAALRRAGANFVLSESTLGAKLLQSVIHDSELVVVGEEVDLFLSPVPHELGGCRLDDSEIGAKTGLSVIGIRRDGDAVEVSTPDLVLESGSEILMLGTKAQRAEFTRVFHT